MLLLLLLCQVRRGDPLGAVCRGRWCAVARGARFHNVLSPASCLSAPLCCSLTNGGRAVRAASTGRGRRCDFRGKRHDHARAAAGPGARAARRETRSMRRRPARGDAARWTGVGPAASSADFKSGLAAARRRYGCTGAGARDLTKAAPGARAPEAPTSRSRSSPTPIPSPNFLMRSRPFWWRTVMGQ
jgi:hypothetical protein